MNSMKDARGARGARKSQTAALKGVRSAIVRSVITSQASQSIRANRVAMLLLLALCMLATGANAHDRVRECRCQYPGETYYDPIGIFRQRRNLRAMQAVTTTSDLFDGQQSDDRDFFDGNDDDDYHTHGHAHPVYYGPGHGHEHPIHNHPVPEYHDYDYDHHHHGTFAHNHPEPFYIPLYHNRYYAIDERTGDTVLWPDHVACAHVEFKCPGEEITHPYWRFSCQLQKRRRRRAGKLRGKRRTGKRGKKQGRRQLLIGSAADHDDDDDDDEDIGLVVNIFDRESDNTHNLDTTSLFQSPYHHDHTIFTNPTESWERQTTMQIFDQNRYTVLLPLSHPQCSGANGNGTTEGAFMLQMVPQPTAQPSAVSPTTTTGIPTVSPTTSRTQSPTVTQTEQQTAAQTEQQTAAQTEPQTAYPTLQPVATVTVAPVADTDSPTTSLFPTVSLFPTTSVFPTTTPLPSTAEIPVVEEDEHDQGGFNAPRLSQPARPQRTPTNVTTVVVNATEAPTVGPDEML